MAVTYRPTFADLVREMSQTRAPLVNRVKIFKRPSSPRISHLIKRLERTPSCVTRFTTATENLYYVTYIMDPQYWKVYIGTQLWELFRARIRTIVSIANVIRDVKGITRGIDISRVSFA